jgi:sarcosine oxidase subunit alpha
MSDSLRLPTGGRIDRDRPLRFSFDGREYSGYRGDTLASALLANGVHAVSRSIRYGRPRGIFTAGVEEPNALVQPEGPCPEPMLTATTVELFDGLHATGLAGKGRLEGAEDHAFYDKFHWHCDVLVVGAGPAGLAAALAAGRSGARVLLADEQPEPGGSLLATRETLDGAPAVDWVTAAVAELAGLPEVRLLARTTVLGAHDNNYVIALERRTDHLGPDAPAHLSRQRVWHIRAGQVVSATGAHERPIAFADNDRPGIMLAAAARTYVNRYAVLPGRRAVVFTTNDSAYAAAIDLADAGVTVVAVVDARAQAPTAWQERCRARDRGAQRARRDRHRRPSARGERPGRGARRGGRGRRPVARDRL